MGRRSSNRGQQPIKGFRPGKEPPQLRKKRARAQLGKDASWAQKQVVEAVGDKSPEEVQALMNRWTTILFIVTLALLGGGLLLYMWSIIAGVVVHLLTLGAAFLWFRVRGQRNQLVAMAESMGVRGPGTSGRSPRKRGR